MLVARLEPPRILIEFFVQERRQSKGSQGDLLGLAGRITNHESRIKNREFTVTFLILTTVIHDCLDDSRFPLRLREGFFSLSLLDRFQQSPQTAAPQRTTTSFYHGSAGYRFYVFPQPVGARL